MGLITDIAKVTYSAGPASSPFNPDKGQIIALFSILEGIIGTAVNGLVIGSTVVYATRAALFADLNKPANTLGLVYNDSTAAYNGIYVKSGASGSGSWTLTNLLLPSSFIAELATARGDFASLGDRLATMVPVIPGIFDDLGASPQYNGGSVSLRGSANRELGATIPSGSTGQNTALATSMAIDPVTASELSSRTLRLVLAFSTSATFTRAPSVAVNLAKQDGSTVAATATVISNAQTGPRRLMVIETTITSDTTAIQPYVTLTASGATSSAEFILLTGALLAVKTTNADNGNVESENAERGRRLTLLSATSDAGPIMDDASGVGQMFNGAAYRFSADGQQVIGWTIPTGSTGQNSFVQSDLGLSTQEAVALAGSTIEWQWVLDTSTGYTRRITPAFSVDGNLVASAVTFNQAIGPNTTLISIQAVIPAGAQRLMPFIQSTGAGAATNGEYAQIKDISARVIASGDRSKSAARLSGYWAALRNRNRGNAALESASSPDTIRPTSIDLAVAVTDTIAARLDLAPYPSVARRRKVQLDAGTFLQSGIFPRPYDTVVGKGRNRTIINCSLPANSALATIAGVSVIEAYRDVDYADMSIIARNMRYGIHSDLPSEVKSIRQRYRNVEVTHFGNDDAVAYQAANGGDPNGVWPTTHAFGAGGWSGWDISIEDCKLTGHRAAVAIHDNIDFSAPARWSIAGSILAAIKDGGYALELSTLGAGLRSKVEIVGNSLGADINYQAGVTWLPTTLSKQPANHAEIDLFGHGNTPAVFRITDPGRALKIESAATSGTSTIAVSGTAAAVLFGNVTRRDGAGGIKGYSFGDVDVSERGVGAAGNVFITSLGKRLGNCTTTSKRLTVSINGAAAVNVDFTQDHTNQSNATVLGLINAVLGANAIASLYAVGERYRPHITDEEKALKNVGTTGIVMGMACAYVGDGTLSIRVMTSDDAPSLFAGIAWEDIYPGNVGRVKTNGYLPASDLLRSDSAAMVLNTPLSVDPASPGKFAVSASRAILYAIRADVVTLDKASMAIADEIARIDAQARSLRLPAVNRLVDPTYVAAFGGQLMFRRDGGVDIRQHHPAPLNQQFDTARASRSGRFVEHVAPSGRAWFGPKEKRGLKAYTKDVGGVSQVFLSAAGRSEFQVTFGASPCWAATIEGAVLTWLEMSGGVAVEHEMPLVGMLNLSAGVNVLNHILIHGQSNSYGSVNQPAVSTTAPMPGRLKMLAGGQRSLGHHHNTGTNSLLPDQHIFPLADGVEVTDAGSGESPATQLGYEFLSRRPATEALVTSCHGIGGQGMAALRRGTLPYANALKTVMWLRAACWIEGIEYRLVGMYLDQGENGINMSQSAKMAELTSFQSELTQDVNAIRGGAAEVIAAMVQTSNFTKYNVTTSAVPLAQLQLAIDQPGKFLCVGPRYTEETVADGVHIINEGSAFMGAIGGRALADTLSGGNTMPLYVTSAVRSGSSVVVTFNRAIVLDTSLVTNPGNYGVTWIDDTASATVSSVAAGPGADQITVTLSGTPTGANPKIGIAASGTSGANGGPSTGARAPIHDTSAAVSQRSRAMHRYASHQTPAVTV